MNEKRLFLEQCHLDFGAKMVVFAGYNMPLSYTSGIIQEHLHTRVSAGLFDISHMGQYLIQGKEVPQYLSSILPIYCDKLGIGKSRYTLLLNDSAGIIDDVILTRREETVYSLVLNAARIEADLKHLHVEAKKYPSVKIEALDTHVLLAIQGPKSESILAEILGGQVSQLLFMQGMALLYKDSLVWINRSGYTGEDGFELSVPHRSAKELYKTFIAHDSVQAIGLGARDTLRLEAGLSLYGHDIDESSNPFEADLGFALSKKRLHEENGTSFIGKKPLQVYEKEVPKKLKVGIRPEGRALIREGIYLFASESDIATEGNAIGRICSGGFGASVNAPIALAYVNTAYSQINQKLWANLRGRMLAVHVVTLPFVAHQYKK